MCNDLLWVSRRGESCVDDGPVVGRDREVAHVAAIAKVLLVRALGARRMKTPLWFELV